MATAIASRQCSKCKDSIGSFNCEGCKEIFCTKHSIAHRQELSNKFEQLMTNANVMLQETKDKEQPNESLKQEFHHHINEWENNMFEKVRERAEQIRQQVNELIDKKNKNDINNLQPMMDEMRKRYEKEDYLESDISQIEQNLNKIQQTIQQSDIELFIQPNMVIDWENLIRIEENSNTPQSSVTSKKTSNSNDKKSFQNTTNNSNPIRNSVFQPQAYYPPMFGPTLNNVPFVRPAGVYMSSYYPTPPPTTDLSSHLTASPVNQPTTASVVTEKRSRKPLVIVDPHSHKCVDLSQPSSTADTNQPSSYAEAVVNRSNGHSSNSASVQEFRRIFAKLLNDSSNT